MNVKQFHYAADNLGYVVHGHTHALAIDGGAVEKILTYLRSNRLELTWVLNTHGHPDHTAGTSELLRRAGARYLDNDTLRAKGAVHLDGEVMHILHTPGHTEDSLTFNPEGILITGDTLFNGTVGNCFSGDLKGFYRSIKTLARFPGDTVIYAGHDYVRESIAFARSLETANPALDRYLDRYNPRHVRSTLAEERQVNPYLRFNEASLIEILKRRGARVDTEYDRWLAMMSI
jgi:hydroxyacylglutathione hydrolase